MLAHLALATALVVAATHLAPSLPDSPTSAVVLATPAPNASVHKPGYCPPASGQPVYRDLSGTTLIPAIPRTPLENPGPPS